MADYDPYESGASAPLLSSPPVAPPTAPLQPAYAPGMGVSSDQMPTFDPDLATKLSPVLPPSFEPSPSLLDPKNRTTALGENFTVADALQAMERHAQSKCCLKSGITNELNVLEMRVMSAVHIIFESSTEMRSTVTASVAYTPGTMVDGPNNGKLFIIIIIIINQN